MSRLPRKVESLEGIDEQFHPLYRPITEEGRDEPIAYEFGVEIEGLVPEEKIDGYERNREEMLTELKKLRDKYRGIDPAQFEKLKKMQQEMEREKAESKGDFQALEKQLREQHEAEKKMLAQQVRKYRDRIEDLMVTQVATSELATAKGRVNVLLPHVQGKVRVVEEDEGSGDFRVEVLGPDSRPRLSTKGNPKSIKELVEEMKASDDFSILFEGSGATGGGAAGSRGPAPSGAVVLRGDDRKDVRKYQQAKAEADKRGVELVMQE